MGIVNGLKQRLGLAVQDEDRALASMRTALRATRFGGESVSAYSRDLSERAIDEFRTVKRQVIGRALAGEGRPGRDPRVVLVTSALSGEGKTYVAFNLAISMGMDPGITVTLVDGYVDARGASRRLSEGRGFGLVDCLANGGNGVERGLMSSGYEGVDILGAGGNRDLAPELLGSSAMQTLLDGLLRRSAHHFVIIDSGPLFGSGSAIALAPHVGQILFVIEEGRTPRSDAESSLELLDRVAGPLSEKWFGFVLNRSDPADSLTRA